MMVTLGVTDGDETVTVAVVTRAADSYDAKGNGVKGEDNDPVNIEVDIQPPSGKVLEDLPEGVRSQIEYVLWTPFDLKVDHVIVYQGDSHRVFKTWERRLDGFTKAVIGKKKS